MLSDAVVINTQFPSSNLKKRMKLVSQVSRGCHGRLYPHSVHKKQGDSIFRKGHIKNKLNTSDILPKALRPSDFYRLLIWLLYGRAEPDPDVAVTRVKGSSSSKLTQGKT